MGDLVNLRQVRKHKQRQDREKLADANRHAFGRTKAEKQRKKAETELAYRKLDGHKRETEE